MAQERTRGRTSSNLSSRPPVRLSVPVDVGTHAKLCAIAALRQIDRSELAAGFIVAALRGVVISERGDAAGDADDDGEKGKPAPRIANL